ncbi:MAG TPA: zinc-binding dehydrogenase [Nocardioidaceae bacterium]|nr:zinc-binding dehydrogenase [Nocardioidaceae bacterium]
MNAIVFHEYGGPEVLRWEQVAAPTADVGHVVVKVGACSINRGPDAMVRSGKFGLTGNSLPHVSGADAAGTITQIGDDVTGVKVGDRVAVYPILSCDTWCNHCPRLGENYCAKFRVVGVQTWGGHAEYVAVPARNVVPIADSLSFEAAAMLGVSYITAWHGMITKAATQPGETILVMAAGSGVGAAAIQIGAMLGARVLATTGAPWKAEKAREIGADEVFDYNDPGWTEKVRTTTDGHGVDVLFDNVGGTWTQSVPLLARGGRLFCSGATSQWDVNIDLRQLYRNMNTLHFYMQGTKEEMGVVADLMAQQRLLPVIDSVYPMSQAREAHQRLNDNNQFGKIVLRPDAE